MDQVARLRLFRFVPENGRAIGLTARASGGTAKRTLRFEETRSVVGQILAHDVRVVSFLRPNRRVVETF
jgi:hypothetical protein